MRRRAEGAVGGGSRKGGTIIAHGGRRSRQRTWLGAKDCTPEIDLSEILADVTVSGNFQWMFSGILQWMFTFPVDFTGTVSGIFQWMFTSVSSGVR